MDVVNMFPLSVYRDALALDAADTDALTGWVREMRASGDVARPSEQAWSGDLNAHESIHTDARFAPLAGRLRTHIDAYLGVLGVRADAFDVHLVRSWATVSHGRERIAAHSHPHAHLAVVYYLRLPGGDGTIGFGSESPPNELAPNLFDDAMLRLGHLAARTPYNCREVFLQVREGDLVLFPAKTPHFTVPGAEGPDGTPAGERISLVGDLVLTLRSSTYVENFLPGVASWRAL